MKKNANAHDGNDQTSEIDTEALAKALRVRSSLRAGEYESPFPIPFPIPRPFPGPNPNCVVCGLG